MGDQSATEIAQGAAYSFPNIAAPYHLLVEDLNNDGRPDLAMGGMFTWTGPEAPFAYIQKSDGKFAVQDPALITKNANFVAQVPFPIDLDGDGVMDLVALNILPSGVSEIQSWLVTLPQ